MQKSTSNNHVIAVSLIIVGVVIVAFMLTKNTPAVDNLVVEEPYNGEATQNFNFLMPEAWSFTETAVKDIQTILPGQVLNFGIVPNLNDQGAYYFATSAPDSKTAGFLYSIYQYNNDYTFERIYRVSYGPLGKKLDGIRPNVASWNLHAIGQDGYKLILLAEDAESSRGPCTEVYTLGRESDDEMYEMLSLDLLDPFHIGLQPYEVPDDIYDQALERQNGCVIN